MSSTSDLIQKIKKAEKAKTAKTKIKQIRDYVLTITDILFVLTPDIIEAIQNHNPTFEGFSDLEFKVVTSRLAFENYFSKLLNSSKKEDVDFIKTLIRKGYQYQTVLLKLSKHPNRLEFVDPWIEHISNQFKNVGDTTTFIDDVPMDFFEYYFYLNGTNDEFLIKLFSGIFSTFIYNPINPVIDEYQRICTNKYNSDKQLFKDISLQMWNYSSEDDEFYLTRTADGFYYKFAIKEHIPRFIQDFLIISYLFKHSVQQPNNTKLKEILKKAIPLTPDSAFIKIYENLASVQDNYADQYISKEMIESREPVKQFISENYDFEKINNVTRKEKSLGMSVDKLLKNLPIVHQKSIFMRDKNQIKNYFWDKRFFNKEDIYGMTPITYSVLFNNVEMFEFLMNPSSIMSSSRGKTHIDIFKVTVPYTKDGISLYEMASLLKHTQILELITSKEERILRWKQNTKIGYHQTNEAVAHIIENTPANEFHFLAGGKGMFGAGIYFAETPTETNYKAIQKGPILKANMLLGNPKNLYNHKDRTQFYKDYKALTVDADELHYLLQRDGFDSVIAVKSEKTDEFMKSGTEYMVYSTEQAEFLQKLDNPLVKKTQFGGTSSPSMSFNKLMKHPWILSVRKGRLDILKYIKPEKLAEKWIFNTTPLMIACARGHLEIVKWFIETMKVNVDEKDFKGRNALFYAMRGGYSHIIQYLINHTNINMLVKDVNGQFAIEWFSIYRLINNNKKRKTDSIDYRQLLLDKLYEIHPVNSTQVEAITRFYNCTGRLSSKLNLDELKEGDAAIEIINNVEIKSARERERYVELLEKYKKNNTKISRGNVSRPVPALLRRERASRPVSASKK